MELPWSPLAFRLFLIATGSPLSHHLGESRPPGLPLPPPQVIQKLRSDDFVTDDNLGVDEVDAPREALPAAAACQFLERVACHGERICSSEAAKGLLKNTPQALALRGHLSIPNTKPHFTVCVLSFLWSSSNRGGCPVFFVLFFLNRGLVYPKLGRTRQVPKLKLGSRSSKGARVCVSRNGLPAEREGFWAWTEDASVTVL